MEGKRIKDLVHDAIRLNHYSRRTEQAYYHWIKEYIRFHGLVHPTRLNAGQP